MSRMPYKGGIVAAVLAAALLAGACSSGQGNAQGAQPQPRVTLVSAAPNAPAVDWVEGTQTTSIKVFFAYEPNVEQRRPPFTRPAAREVHSDEAGVLALQALFDGPRRDEEAKGLRFESSGATGVSDLRVVNGVASLKLVGGCDAHGSPVTVGEEITNTLKQFKVVKAVKIYGPDGTTTDPSGTGDSLPACLVRTTAVT
ncbi:MAG: hypothetical protein K1X95_08385 [Acidimicrobiia bacterium]|nr:hypothetical protein [Acidimicrobiia bacterium]